MLVDVVVDAFDVEAVESGADGAVVLGRVTDAVVVPVCVTAFVITVVVDGVGVEPALETGVVVDGGVVPASDVPAEEAAPPVIVNCGLKFPESPNTGRARERGVGKGARSYVRTMM